MLCISNSGVVFGDQDLSQLGGRILGWPLIAWHHETATHPTGTTTATLPKYGSTDQQYADNYGKKGKPWCNLQMGHLDEDSGAINCGHLSCWQARCCPYWNGECNGLKGGGVGVVCNIYIYYNLVRVWRGVHAVLDDNIMSRASC